MSKKQLSKYNGAKHIFHRIIVEGTMAC